ncbi:hypothetical protein ACHAXS_004865 [Conticribra weissflogii]
MMSRHKHRYPIADQPNRRLPCDKKHLSHTSALQRSDVAAHKIAPLGKCRTISQRGDACRRFGRATNFGKTK